MDELHKLKDNKVSEYYRPYDKNYISNLARVYDNISNETKQFIFQNKNVKQIENKILNLKKTDAKTYNKKINDLITQLRNEIGKSTGDFLKRDTSITNFVTDITSLIGKSDIDKYTNIIKNLGSSHQKTSVSDSYITNLRMILENKLKKANVDTSQFVNDKQIQMANNTLMKALNDGKLNNTVTKQWLEDINAAKESRLRSLQHIPHDMFLQLSMLRLNDKKSYRRSHFIYSQKSSN